MSTRLHPGPGCRCLAPVCRLARRAETRHVYRTAAVAVVVIFCSLWAVYLIGVTP